jgi:predicted Zn-ribbon and HTH transcriptional regulator
MSTDHKPSKNEDEYFLLQDAELIKEQRAKLDAEREAATRRAHFMKCPKCGADLKVQTLKNVSVDACPDCKGLWLDAGELELIGKVKDSAMSTFLRDLLKGLPGS